MDQPCVNDPVSPRVFCHVGFDAGVSGSLTVEHLVVLSTPTASPAFWLLTLNGNPSGPLVGVNDGRQTVESPIAVTTEENFGADKRTRLTMFATGISGTAVNSDVRNDVTINGVVKPNFAESVAVQAQLADGRIISLPVEFAAAQGTVPGLDQVNVVLLPELRGAGVIQLALIIGGQRSNAPTIVVR